jgi:hypothetical protein
MTYYLRIIVVLSFCLLALLGFCVDRGCLESATSSGVYGATITQIIADQAEITGQLFENFQPDVVVTAVELEITPEGVHLLEIDKERHGIALEAEVIRTEDVGLLELVKSAFDARYCYHQFRELSTDGDWGGGSLDQPYGNLRIFTDKGVRSFGVSRYGFSRSNGPAGIKHGFFSATAAEFVNILFARKHSYSMPPLLLEGLSGERQLSQDRRFFQAMREARAAELVE